MIVFIYSIEYPFCIVFHDGQSYDPPERSKTRSENARSISYDDIILKKNIIGNGRKILTTIHSFESKRDGLSYCPNTACFAVISQSADGISRADDLCRNTCLVYPGFHFPFTHNSLSLPTTPLDTHVTKQPNHVTKHSVVGTSSVREIARDQPQRRHVAKQSGIT